ncbi:hypothetical protein, partial [Salmonella sp. s60131]|uniref:hypothetical protein n=1 Tax=Salmonella sp. s60131 TaxID=3159722 RepID=UPI00397EE2F9
MATLKVSSSDPYPSEDAEQLKTAFEATAQGGRGVIQYEEGQAAQFASYASTRLNWGVFITAPAKDLHAPVNELSIKLLAISLV